VALLTEGAPRPAQEGKEVVSEAVTMHREKQGIKGCGGDDADQMGCQRRWHRP
jgi:hypothetical protein